MKTVKSPVDAGIESHHDAQMRTTLTLEPDVARLLEEEAHRQRKSFKHVVNEALRRGLAPTLAARPPGRFRVRPHRTTLRPGIDAGSLNRLVDELEDEAIVEKLRGGR
jgi:hypothetical protein